MTAEEQQSKQFLFDPATHKQYDAQFYCQKDTDLPMADAIRSPDAARAYQDVCTSLRLVGLLPQMKRAHIKRCETEARKERTEIEQKNAGPSLIFFHPNDFFFAHRHYLQKTQHGGDCTSTSERIGCSGPTSAVKQATFFGIQLWGSGALLRLCAISTAS